MEERNGVKEVTLTEALEIVRKNNVKLVWLGREDLEYVSGLLKLKNNEMISVGPNELLGSPEKARQFENAIMVCYHGNTSAVVARILKERYKVNTYSLKGGVTATLGEIF